LLLLGRTFKPVSTETLAALVKMRPISVRSIEAGRRVLNEEDRRKIAIYAGAEWDNETHQWICSWSAKSEKKIPFDRLAHECYIAKLDSGRSIVPGNQVSFEKALDFLLNRIPAKAANIALLRLRELLIEIGRENGLEGDDLDYLEECTIVQGLPGETFPVRIEESGEIIQYPLGKGPPVPLRIKSVKKTSKKQRPSGR
jgi:hypothetical protein